MLIGVVPSVLRVSGADGGRVDVGTGGGRTEGKGACGGVGETPPGDDGDLEGMEKAAGAIHRSRIRRWIQALYEVANS
jgi:hypothetical protein